MAKAKKDVEVKEVKVEMSHDSLVSRDAAIKQAQETAKKNAQK